ncbi:restriction endonuclease subunit S [Methylomonas sp. LL1]|uniref:restriction endonuclease subunit S n=1 Tax=Methylomonas sp. LL1 TaxID=2785785 RepID=UPI0018C39857|nr:restriction endonuclease subunit S [Methylomonas sp. LL1]QPK62883.1 restriction endonuclease subunit S [Methylomonas sp. LL1]
MNLENQSRELPKSWVVVKLGDFVVSEKGKKPKSESNIENSTHLLPYVDIQAFEEGVIKSWTDGVGCRLCFESDFLMVWDGSRSGLVGKGVNGALGSTLVRINFPSMVNDYAFYFLQSKYQQINTRAKGSGTPHVDPDLIWNYQFPIPPINEQHRIVAKIEALFSELDKGIESFKTAREQLKIYRQALLKHAFSGKLTEQWRAENASKLESTEALLQRIQTERQQRYQQQLKDWEANGRPGSKPKAPKTLPTLTTEELAELPGLPEDWIYVRAEEISDFITKGTTPSKELLFEGDGEIPFIKVYNLTKTGFLDFSIDPTFVNRQTHNGFLARSKVYPSDVLMNIVGPPLGKVSIVPDSYPEWNINQAIAIFRTELVSIKFLAAYLSFEDTVRAMMKKSKATAGQFNLTLEICRETPIPFCGKLEQIEIEYLVDTKISGIDQLDQTITTALQQAEALRQSILKKAFSGQLVPQDPNDEPASVLLERIRAEKAQANIQPTRRRVKTA